MFEKNPAEGMCKVRRLGGGCSFETSALWAAWFMQLLIVPCPPMSAGRLQTVSPSEKFVKGAVQKCPPASCSMS